MADEGLDLAGPTCLHLVSAFLAMEPPDSLVSLARVCGGGLITERVQRFIWGHCIKKSDGRPSASYLKNFLKKLILEVECKGGVVLDELYERYAFYMASLKDDEVAKGDSWVLKCISFLFPDDCREVRSCPKSMKLLVPLQCSLNMLEGDTGCSIWPSGLLLSEFILLHPEIFSSKTCFEVGSGVGLTGICLAHVKASKVILSDGDLSSLANMKLNLELNHLSLNTDFSERDLQNPNSVQCIHLPWEFAVESRVQEFVADIVLGADVIYDPSCLPHLIRVLSALLGSEKSYSHHRTDDCPGSLLDGRHIDDGHPDTRDLYRFNERKTLHNNHLKTSDSADDMPCFDVDQGRAKFDSEPSADYQCHTSKEGPVAYIASVIRNIDTFNYFLALAEQANLSVTDITESVKLLDLLPYMHSYDRSVVRLFTVCTST